LHFSGRFECASCAQTKNQLPVDFTGNAFPIADEFNRLESKATVYLQKAGLSAKLSCSKNH
jgi:hypothetical protein